MSADLTSCECQLIMGVLMMTVYELYRVFLTKTYCSLTWKILERQRTPYTCSNHCNSWAKLTLTPAKSASSFPQISTFSLHIYIDRTMVHFAVDSVFQPLRGIGAAVNLHSYVHMVWAW
jgi:glycopeptide antibiotics resistance protein